MIALALCILATATRAVGIPFVTISAARAARSASSPVDRSTPMTATIWPPTSGSNRTSSPSTSRIA